MAVVREIHNGPCVIRIHDDCYAHLTPEELKAREERVKENCRRIVINSLLRQAEKEEGNGTKGKTSRSNK